MNFAKILCYHSVSDSNIVLNAGINIKIDKFKKQIQYLINKYEPVDINNLLHDLFNPNKFLITFDDGYKDNYNIIKHFLVPLNIPVILYITTDKIDKCTYFFNKKSKLDNLSTQEIAELSKLPNVIIGSHTHSHPILSNYPYNNILNELSGSKQILEQLLDDKIEHFSYPFGDYNILIKYIAKDLGYKTAVSVKKTDNDIYSIKRIPIHFKDSMLKFKIKLRVY